VDGDAKQMSFPGWKGFHSDERVEFSLQRLADSGRTCPVGGGEARSQWLQHAWNIFTWETEMRDKMAGKKTALQKQVNDVQWVNYKLTDGDKEMFQAWDAPEDDVKSLFVELVNGGYRLTYAFDRFNKAIMVSVVCQAEGNPNFGKGFSTFAHDWDKLNALVAFKHIVLWSGVWPSDVADVPREDFG